MFNQIYINNKIQKNPLNNKYDQQNTINYNY